MRLRKAQERDVVPLLQLINGYAARGLLLERSEDSLRARLGDFSVAEADGALLGCGALSELAPTTATSAGLGEVKSMRTARPARGRGVAGAVLDRLVALARERGYAAVSLETGPQEYFAPARRLYARHGFVPCGPFGSYSPDPCSVFRTLDLTDDRTDAAVGPAA